MILTCTVTKIRAFINLRYKKILPLFLILALILPALPGFSQKYKTAEDTVKLSKEYTKINEEIAEINAKLLIAENELAGYQSKAREADNDAAKAASSSSNQASKAENGSVRDARSAKKKADKAYDEAKDSKRANNNLKAQEEKIAKYKSIIRKKQKRLDELNEMRTNINAKL